MYGGAVAQTQLSIAPCTQPHKPVPYKEELKHPATSHCIKATTSDSTLRTDSCMCVEKSPEAVTTEETISTASAHPHTPTTSSTNHTPPFAAFLGTTTGRGTPLYTVTGQCKSSQRSAITGEQRESHSAMASLAPNS